MSLDKFTSSKPVRTNNALPEGRHDVHIIRVVRLESDRMKDFSGHMKSDAELAERGIDWVDDQEQLGLVVQDEEGRTMPFRLNTLGFQRFDELVKTKGFIKSAHDEGYAIDAKTRKRVVDQNRTAQCMNIINELFWNCEIKDGENWVRMPEESKINKLLGARLNINVTPKTYRGKDVPPDIGQFRPYGYKESEERDAVEEPSPLEEMS